MPHASKSKSKSKAGCGCAGPRPKSRRPKRKMNAAMAWIVSKNKELRREYPGKPFGWYGKKAGEMYRASHKK
jgi:hypothetical protein